MKVSELELLLEKYDDDADVFIRTEDGTLHDIDVQGREATFDGFDTVYEEGIDLLTKD